MIDIVVGRLTHIFWKNFESTVTATSFLKTGTTGSSTTSSILSFTTHNYYNIRSYICMYILSYIFGHRL